MSEDEKLIQTFVVGSMMVLLAPAIGVFIGFILISIF